MSGWRRTAELIGLRIPAWQEPLFDFLEREGLRFCVHFGTDQRMG